MTLQMTSRERVLAALQGEETDRLPVISVCQHATYEQMEKLGVGWPEAHNDAEKMAALSAGGYSLLGLDAVRAPYCQTFEAEALGSTIKDGGQKNLPSIATHPYKIGEEPVFPADFLALGRIPQLLKAVKILKETLGDKVIIMGGIVGPFSIAASLVGVTEMLMAGFKKPESVQPYIEVAEKAGTMLAKALVEAGADVIVVEDMMASLDMISPKIYRGLAAPYAKTQFAQIPAPTIVHICGKLDAVILDIAQTGPTAISVEPAVNVPAALEKFQAENIKVPLIGAVDPVQTLFSGSPDEVRAEVEKAAREGINLISPGCAVAPATPTANLLAMVEAVKA
jgi:[methyl-Co(III) methanol-specific corrinoid protein]:coenzyme M methyltransferase